MSYSLSVEVVFGVRLDHLGTETNRVLNFLSAERGDPDAKPYTELYDADEQLERMGLQRVIAGDIANDYQIIAMRSAHLKGNIDPFLTFASLPHVDEEEAATLWRLAKACKLEEQPSRIAFAGNF